MPVDTSSSADLYFAKPSLLETFSKSADLIISDKTKEIRQLDSTKEDAQKQVNETLQTFLKTPGKKSGIYSYTHLIELLKKRQSKLNLNSKADQLLILGIFKHVEKLAGKFEQGNADVLFDQIDIALTTPEEAKTLLALFQRFPQTAKKLSYTKLAQYVSSSSYVARNIYAMSQFKDLKKILDASEQANQADNLLKLKLNYPLSLFIAILQTEGIGQKEKSFTSIDAPKEFLKQYIFSVAENDSKLATKKNQIQNNIRYLVTELGAKSFLIKPLGSSGKGTQQHYYEILSEEQIKTMLEYGESGNDYLTLFEFLNRHNSTKSKLKNIMESNEGERFFKLFLEKLIKTQRLGISKGKIAFNSEFKKFLNSNTQWLTPERLALISTSIQSVYREEYITYLKKKYKPKADPRSRFEALRAWVVTTMGSDSDADKRKVLAFVKNNPDISGKMALGKNPSVIYSWLTLTDDSAKREIGRFLVSIDYLYLAYQSEKKLVAKGTSGQPVAEITGSAHDNMYVAAREKFMAQYQPNIFTKYSDLKKYIDDNDEFFHDTAFVIAENKNVWNIISARGFFGLEPESSYQTRMSDLADKSPFFRFKLIQQGILKAAYTPDQTPNFLEFMLRTEEHNYINLFLLDNKMREAVKNKNPAVDLFLYEITRYLPENPLEKEAKLIALAEQYPKTLVFDKASQLLKEKLLAENTDNVSDQIISFLKGTENNVAGVMHNPSEGKTRQISKINVYKIEYLIKIAERHPNKLKALCHEEIVRRILACTPSAHEGSVGQLFDNAQADYVKLNILPSEKISTLIALARQFTRPNNHPTVQDECHQQIVLKLIDAKLEDVNNLTSEETKYINDNIIPTLESFEELRKLAKNSALISLKKAVLARITQKINDPQTEPKDIKALVMNSLAQDPQQLDIVELFEKASDEIFKKTILLDDFTVPEFLKLFNREKILTKIFGSRILEDAQEDKILLKIILSEEFKTKQFNDDFIKKPTVAAVYSRVLQNQAYFDQIKTNPELLAKVVSVQKAQQQVQNSIVADSLLENDGKTLFELWSNSESQEQFFTGYDKKIQQDLMIKILNSGENVSDDFLKKNEAIALNIININDLDKDDYLNLSRLTELNEQALRTLANTKVAAINFVCLQIAQLEDEDDGDEKKIDEANVFKKKGIQVTKLESASPRRTRQKVVPVTEQNDVISENLRQTLFGGGSHIPPAGENSVVKQDSQLSSSQQSVTPNNF